MTEGDGGETGGGDEEPTIDGDDELTYGTPASTSTPARRRPRR